MFLNDFFLKIYNYLIAFQERKHDSDVMYLLKILVSKRRHDGTILHLNPHVMCLSN